MSKAKLINRIRPPLRRETAGITEPRSLWAQYEAKLTGLGSGGSSDPITSAELLRDVKRLAELRRGQGNLAPFLYPTVLEPPWTVFRSLDLTQADRYVLGYTGAICVSPVSRLLRKGEVVPLRFTAKPYQPLPLRFIRAVMCEEDTQPQHTLGCVLGLSSDWITSFEMIATGEELGFQIVCPQMFSDLLLGLLFTQYPKSRFEILDQDLLGDRVLQYAWSYHLKASHLFPLGETIERQDALSFLAGAMEVLGQEEQAVLQILVTPCQEDWAYNLKQAVMDEMTGGPRQAEVDLEAMAQQKTQTPFFAVALRIAGTSPEAMYRLHRYLGLFRAEFQELIPTQGDAYLLQAIRDRISFRPGMLLNAGELTNLAHLPTELVISDNLERVKIPQVGAPRDLNVGMLIGVNRYRNQEARIRLSDTRINRHLLIAGATRMGKSTLLTHSIRDAMERGKGLAVFDPKGSLARTVLRLVPANRVADVIFFRAGDRAYPFSLNIFQIGEHRPKSDVIQDFITLVDKTSFFRGDPLTARMIRILRNTMLVFFQIRGATLRDISSFLDDSDTRRQVLAQLDPERNRFLIRFWRSIDARIDPRLRYDVSAEGVINRLDQFVGDELIGKMLCQRVSKLDFDDVVTNNRIFIADLSDIGQERRAILGRLLVTELELSAMNRAVAKRSDFYLFLDEVQEYITPAMEDILSMGAEFRLSLIMAHQNMAQIPQGLRSSIFGNVGTIISFRLGADYASLMSRQFGGQFESKHFTQLPPYEALVKVDEHNFTMSALAPEWERGNFQAPDFSEEIVRRCRVQYARPIQDVEAEWEMGILDTEPEEERNQAPEERVNRTRARINIQGNMGEESKRELLEQIIRALSPSDSPP